MTEGEALTLKELAQLDSYQRQIEQDLEIHSWWQQASRTDSFSQVFELVPDPHGMGGVIGFYDEIPITGKGRVPIMGVMQEIFYDHVKAPPAEMKETAELICRQLKEFALRYYLRIEKRSVPQAYPELSHPGLPTLLANLSWCPAPDPKRAGFGNWQIYYKRCNGGRIGKFPLEDWQAILNLRRIGSEFDWVVMETEIYDFSWNSTLGASAANWPALTVTLPQTLRLALIPQLITNEDHPATGELGIYGPGVAFLREPGQTFVAYGPAKIQPAFEQVRFHVYADGSIRVFIPWVTDQPKRILNASLNPLDWTLGIANRLTGGISDRVLDLLPGAGIVQDLRQAGPIFDPVMTFISTANALSGGWAGRTLGISKDQLKREMLFLHCLENYLTVLGTLPVWKQVPDWLDEPSLPEWIRTGRLA